MVQKRHLAEDNRSSLSRRELLAGAAGLAAAAHLARPVLADDAPHFEVAFAAQRTAAAPTELNRFPRMVQEYFVASVRKTEEAANRLRASLRTKQDAQAYVATVRDKIQQCFGPWPKKTPLRPRITGVVERDTYRIEKIVFESRPGFLVTGNLYVPKGREFPLPGVVGTCGHSANGKASEAYQSFSQGLARQGYVVLIFDPLGQGERLQYTGDMLQPVPEHLNAGNQQFLVGEFLGTWRAWDGIRALDYLLSRKEVDPRHVGVTGNSGGGTMTTWLCGVERRWTMAAPACFVTTWRRNTENELPADTEQCPPRALALGLDHSDFLAAMAPRPVVLLAQERDFFDVRGAQEAFERLKQLYRLLGAEENVSLVVGPNPHGYSQENREAMYRWFNRVTRVSDAETEPPIAIEKDETLWCTPHGQVAEFDSRPVYSYTRERSRALAASRKPPTSEALREAVVDVLRLKPVASAVDYRILRTDRDRGYPEGQYATVYAVETEPGIQALVYRLAEERHMSRPTHSSAPAILYVVHDSSDEELRSEPLVRELLAAEPEAAFYACDVRGLGESRPNTCGADAYRKPYGSDYFYAILSIMYDRPYAGQRTFDVLRVIEFLAAAGHEEIHLAANGWGTIPGAFAALLSDRVARVTLKHALRSYAAVAESRDYAWPLSSFVPNLLARLDLPDCYKELKSKRLRMIDPVGVEGVPESAV